MKRQEVIDIINNEFDGNPSKVGSALQAADVRHFEETGEVSHNIRSKHSDEVDRLNDIFTAMFDLGICKSIVNN